MRKNIGFREYRNVGFVKQVYGANVRNMGIVSAILFLLWVELVIYFIKTRENTILFIAYTAVVAVFCGAWLHFVSKPYSHPVYRQISRYFGKAKEDIERGVAEINSSFVDQNLGYSFNKNHFSDTWFVRRNFLFSDIVPLPTPEEMEEMHYRKLQKKQERKEKRANGGGDPWKK